MMGIDGVSLSEQRRLLLKLQQPQPSSWGPLGPRDVTGPGSRLCLNLAEALELIFRAPEPRKPTRIPTKMQPTKMQPTRKIILDKNDGTCWATLEWNPGYGSWFMDLFWLVWEGGTHPPTVVDGSSWIRTRITQQGMGQPNIFLVVGSNPSQKYLSII